jgi:hypothetical protein
MGGNKRKEKIVLIIELFIRYFREARMQQQQPKYSPAKPKNAKSLIYTPSNPSLSPSVSLYHIQ